MNISVEEKKKEAIARMKLLGIFKETVRQFQNEDLVSISEPPFGACYWVEGEELDKIRAWEKENNALVYHIVRAFTTFGKMDAYLYVSDYPGEWETDRALLKDGETLSYVINRDAPECSELGCIGIQRTVAAGLKRVY